MTFSKRSHLFGRGCIFLDENPAARNQLVYFLSGPMLSGDQYLIQGEGHSQLYIKFSLEG